MTDRSTADLLATILDIIPRRRLARLLGVSEFTIRGWAKPVDDREHHEPRPAHRAILVTMAGLVGEMQRVEREIRARE